jgi:hypothetical protein
MKTELNIENTGREDRKQYASNEAPHGGMTILEYR